MWQQLFDFRKDVLGFQSHILGGDFSALATGVSHIPFSPERKNLFQRPKPQNLPRKV